MIFTLLLPALASDLLEQPLQQLVQPVIDEHLAGAVIIGVVRKGELAFHSFGALSSGRHPTPTDRFEIGAISKAFNGLLLAQAVENGDLKLDDPISAHLPWAFPSGADGRPITLRHLATHTSGWPSQPTGFHPTDPTDPFKDFDRAALRAAAESTPLVESPGKTYAYSNLGAAVLGAALENALHKPWSALLRERLAQPLHMKQLEADQGHVVQGHNADGAPVGQWTTRAFTPTGGVEASARDLSQLILTSQVPGGKLRGAFDLALTPAVDLGPAGHVGLGWHITPQGLRWQNGETGGFHSMIALHAERQIGVVVLADTTAEIVDAIGFSAIEMLAGQNVAPLPIPKLIDVPASTLQQLVGSWGGASVAWSTDHLVWTEEGRPHRMWPVSSQHFVLRRPPTDLLFQQGQVEVDGPKGIQTLRRQD